MRLYNFREVRIDSESPIYLMLIGMIAIQIAAPLKINIVESFGVWLIFFSSIWAFLFSVKCFKVNKFYMLTVIGLSVVMLLSILSTFNINYQKIVNAFSFLEIPLFLASYPYLNSEKVRKFIYKSYVILSAYYIVIRYTSIAFYYENQYGSSQMTFLTLGHSNPNETAMYLFAYFVILVSLLCELKNLPMKVIVIIELVFIESLIGLTLSRTGILMSLIFLFIAIYYARKKIPNFIRIICCITPFVFWVITLLFDTFLSGLTFLGDTIDTGRFEIYESVFQKMNIITFLIGNFEFQFDNLHNAYWSIFATVGLFGTAIFLCFLFTKIKDIGDSVAKNNIGKVAYIGLMSVIMYTSTETAYLTSGGAFAAMVTSIYLLSVNVLDSQISDPIVNNQMFNGSDST